MRSFRAHGTRSREAAGSSRGHPRPRLPPRESRRFGGSNKLLADLNGRPLLDYEFGAMADAKLASVACVLGADAALILEQVDLPGPRR